MKRFLLAPQHGAPLILPRLHPNAVPGGQSRDVGRVVPGGQSRPVAASPTCANDGADLRMTPRVQAGPLPRAHMPAPPASRRRWQRAGDVLTWAAIAVALVVAYRRLVPDLSLPDLGPAPAVAVADLDGRPHGPADYAGQVVVLNVWATWCPPCVAETPGFVDLAAEFAGDVQFLGLSQDDDPATVRAFAGRHEIPYPLLVGAPVSGTLPPTAVLPTTLVIDRRGRVRLRHEGLLVEPALRSVLRTLAAEPG